MYVLQRISSADMTGSIGDTLTNLRQQDIHRRVWAGLLEKDQARDTAGGGRRTHRSRSCMYSAARGQNPATMDQLKQT